MLDKILRQLPTTKDLHRMTNKYVTSRKSALLVNPDLELGDLTAGLLAYVSTTKLVFPGVPSDNLSSVSPLTVAGAAADLKFSPRSLFT